MSSKSSSEFGAEKFLHFIETDEFVAQWESLGFDDETDLWELQLLIMHDPTVGKVIAGTGGFRKMRFGRSIDSIGKRGGVRVCHVLFAEHGIVLLVTAYGKSEKDDLSAREKRYIREYIDRSRAALDRTNPIPDG